MKHHTRVLRPGLLLVAAILLANPFISTLDVLPDFIAYLCIIGALHGVSSLVPHFDSAIRQAKKLLLVTALKAPSYLWVSAFAAGDERQRVMFTLVCFSFTVVELIWLFPFLRELFAGMDYLAERYGIDSIVATPSYRQASCLAKARQAAYIALPAKLVLAVLPEFSLLSSYDMLGSVTATGRDIASFRPMLTLFAFVIGLGFGIGFLIGFIPLCRALRRDEALEKLLGDLREESLPLQGGERMKRVRYATWCLSLGVFFMIDAVLDGINYLPDAIGILLLGIAALLLRPLVTREASIALVAACLTLPVSVATYCMRHIFFMHYSYEALGRIVEADGLYGSLSTFSVLETVLVGALCVAICCMLCALIREETGYRADNVHNYSSHLPLHKALCRKAVVMATLGTLASAATTADVFLRRITERYKQGAADGAGEVMGGVILPVYGWFWLVVFALCGIYFLYTLHVCAVLNSEVEHKYSIS